MAEKVAEVLSDWCHLMEGITYSSKSSYVSVIPDSRACGGG
jgi:hypothetical protein